MKARRPPPSSPPGTSAIDSSPPPVPTIPTQLKASLDLPRPSSALSDYHRDRDREPKDARDHAGGDSTSAASSASSASFLNHREALSSAFDPAPRQSPNANTTTPPRSHHTRGTGSQGSFSPFLAQAAQAAAASQAAMYSHSRQRSNPTPVPPSPTDSPKPSLLSSQAAAASALGAGQSSPGLGKKEEKKKKLFSKPTRIGTPPTFEKVKKPLPSPNKLTTAHISSPIPKIVGVHDGNRERKSSFGNSVTGGGLAVEDRTGGLGLPQPLFAQGSYSSSPPSSGLLSSKEHHSKTHFLRPRKDPYALTLSSASSNSKLINADAASIYSFGPSSPSTAVFSGTHKDSTHSSSKHTLATSDALNTDEWNFVRKNVLTLFEQGVMRTPVEEMNRYVSAHIRKCFLTSSSVTLLDDVRELLDSGMMTIDPILRSSATEKLVKRLIEVWHYVFGTILPYTEAVFLPLQQEFHGTGSVMTQREARDFWGSSGPASDDLDSNLDVRRIALISFRDNILLPIHPKLRTLFSTLHLDLSSSSNITQTVAKVLQCISVVQGILSGDEAQMKMDELAKTLKHNWLSRGRQGRNRRGFVGLKMKVGSPMGLPPGFQDLQPVIGKG